ncbi:hypothetical protein KFU94_40775 [Chloroflexi bacterium TSY]|nr:hypothetical protein [Chloroflexi bacterium TSY]
MKTRQDLLAPEAPNNIEVVQLTDGTLPSSHIYMEAQIFAPDSSRFILHESATAHGSDRHDPNHRYLLCDLDDNCSLHPITNEVGATAPSVSPDGRYLYYFVDETEPGGGRLTLKQVAPMPNLVSTISPQIGQAIAWSRIQVLRIRVAVSLRRY